MGRYTFLKNAFYLEKETAAFQLMRTSLSFSSNDNLENEDLKKTIPQLLNLSYL